MEDRVRVYARTVAVPRCTGKAVRIGCGPTHCERLLALSREDSDRPECRVLEVLISSLWILISEFWFILSREMPLASAGKATELCRKPGDLSAAFLRFDL